MSDTTPRCFACGRFVDVEEAYYAVSADGALGHAIPCCDKLCADAYRHTVYMARLAKPRKEEDHDE